MKPTMGRIVFYVISRVETPDGVVYGERTRAAVIVSIADEGRELVNLSLFLDGGNDAHMKSTWVTLVKHDEAKTPGTWHWPPRA